MTAVRRLLMTLCLAAAVAPLSAQTTRRATTPATPAPTTVTTDPAATPVRTDAATSQTVTATVSAETDKDVDDPRALRLSLDEAVRTTMQRNLGEVVALDLDAEAGQSLLSQYGIFDPFATATFQHSSRSAPTTSSFQSNGERSTIADIGVSQTLPTGGDYNIFLNNSRSTISGGGTTVSPQVNPELGFAFNQPLARNFGIDITRRGINIARNTLGINRELFRSVLINTAVSVEQAYLDLAYARRNVDVVKQSLFLARDQSRITQIRIDVGASAPLDILQPRVQIATTEEQLIVAVASVRDAEDRLRALLHLDPADWNRPIIPTDPVVYVPTSFNVEDSVARAFQLRPEIHEQSLTTETARIQYLFARNQVLPQVDLAVKYNAAGIAGRSAVVDPITHQLTGQFDTTPYTHAVGQVLRNEFPTWSVGVTFGVPIFNTTARAESKRAELELNRSRTIEDQTKENIAIDVRKAVRDVDTAAREITASRTAREAAEANLDAERKRYENGMTTNFQVLQIQQQLSDARGRELQALVAYNQSVANYHRAVGDLLDVRNITVDEPEPVREPVMFSRFDRYNWLYYGDQIKGDPNLTSTGTTATPEPKP